MVEKMKEYLIPIIKEKMKDNDSSHDFNHALRVMRNAVYIGKKEKADLMVLIPAALFHDVICYPKDDPKSTYSSKESAEFAKSILENDAIYPNEKIKEVYDAIINCSYKKGIVPQALEGKILQDADRLEATGAISIMRTFSSVGAMNKSLYHSDDPFCETRSPEPIEYGLDLFYTRLLVVQDSMHTITARKMAQKRMKILKQFLKNLKQEIKL